MTYISKRKTNLWTLTSSRRSYEGDLASALRNRTMTRVYRTPPRSFLGAAAVPMSP
jgi:hypothetical protein